MILLYLLCLLLGALLLLSMMAMEIPLDELVVRERRF